MRYKAFLAQLSAIGAKFFDVPNGDSKYIFVEQTIARRLMLVYTRKKISDMQSDS